MKLRELLELLKDNLAETSDLVSGPSDRYWTDATLVNYLRTAEREFCDLSRSLIDDTTPEVTRITMKDAVDNYPLHKSIIAVTEVFLPTKGKLDAKSREFVRDVQNARAHRPLWYCADTFAKKIYVAGVPTTANTYAGQKLELRVARFPLCALTLNQPDKEPEIHEQYHEILIEYAMYRALRKHDSEAENLSKANDHLQLFQQTALRVRSLLKEQGATSAAPERRWGFP